MKDLFPTVSKKDSLPSIGTRMAIDSRDLMSKGIVKGSGLSMTKRALNFFKECSKEDCLMERVIFTIWEHESKQPG